MKNIENTFEYALAKEQTIVFIFDSVMKDYVYKNTDMEKYYDQITDILPQRNQFFIKWFKGFVNIAAFEIEEAVSCYKDAFESIEQAEEYTARFIQQAFTLLMYKKDRKNAEKMWNFGVEKKLFAKLDDNFFRNFNVKEQFWVNFPPAMFKDQEKARDFAIKDYKKTYTDKLQESLEKADLKAFKASTKNIDLNTYRFLGASPLYHAIQIKQTMKQGAQAYAQGMTEFRAKQLFSSLDMTNISESKKQETYFTILHQMRQTYETSGLGKIMFYAYYGLEDTLESKIKSLEKIISFIIENTSDLDGFRMHSQGKISNTALHLAAELDDDITCRELLLKGSDPQETIGYADFSFKLKDGKTRSTQLPNSFIYRLINFHSWKTLRMYLKEFPQFAGPAMTLRSEKCNITPLVHLILTQVYTAKDEAQFNQNKKIVDEFLPLFMENGAKLEQKTAFGTAKQLLGM